MVQSGSQRCPPPLPLLSFQANAEGALSLRLPLAAPRVRQTMTRRAIAAGLVAGGLAVVCAVHLWRRTAAHSAKGPRIVCVGHATIDTVLHVPAVPAPPSKVMAKACVQTAGGMATNAASAAARLGAHVTLLSRIGDDAAGVGQGLGVVCFVSVYRGGAVGPRTCNALGLWAGLSGA